MVILLEKEIIMLSSVTYAHKARDFLYRSGIRSRVIKTPSSLSSCGCGHSLEVEVGTPALALLQQERFPIKRTQIVER